MGLLNPGYWWCNDEPYTKLAQKCGNFCHDKGELIVYNYEAVGNLLPAILSIP